MDYNIMKKHSYTELIPLNDWKRKGCKINRGNKLCRSYKSCCECPYRLIID